MVTPSTYLVAQGQVGHKAFLAKSIEARKQAK